MMIFSFLLLIELFFGKISLIPAMHLLLLSPLFKYFSSLISFPLRLKISELTGNILGLMNFDIGIQGNLIIMNGNEFLVDKACTGLHMLTYSFLFGMVILSYFERKKKIVKWHEIALSFLFLLFLNLSSNLVRATLLIIFNIQPDNPLHEILGLMIFLVYVLVPFYLLVNWYYKKKRSESDPVQTPRKINLSRKFVFTGICIGIFILISFKNNARIRNEVSAPEICIEGLEAEKTSFGVTKFSNDSILIYIKPPVAPYSADHNPTVCWNGSGYEFKKIGKMLIHGILVNIAELTKEEDVLYTSWWFDNGNYKTSNQLDWRLKAINDDNNFYLINITSGSKETIQKNIFWLMEQNILPEDETLPDMSSQIKN
jgi:exosortase N